MTTTFENAQVGDRVWDFNYGFGIISKIDKNSTYSILVNFDKQDVCVFNKDGKIFSEVSRTLFWDEIKFKVPTQPQRMKLINGIEVPDISFTPKERDRYYVPAPTLPDFYNECRFHNFSEDYYRAEKGMCYPFTRDGQQAAIQHAKAMLGLKGK